MSDLFATPDIKLQANILKPVELTEQLVDISLPDMVKVKEESETAVNSQEKVETTLDSKESATASVQKTVSNNNVDSGESLPTALSEPTGSVKERNTNENMVNIEDSSKKIEHAANSPEKDEKTINIDDFEATADATKIESLHEEEENEMQKSDPDLEETIDEDEAYDTDLDDDNSFTKFYKNVTANDLYYKACEECGVVPVTYFLAHMHDETVNLSHHGLGPNGARAIAAPLVVNTTITELNLEDNWITAEGMKDITEMLIENCYISILNLAGNKLASAGAKQICSMIQENTNLRELDLSRNDFIDQDAKYFAESLRSNLRLKVLKLSGNSFCERGGEWLGQAIANNEAVENLDLSWNHLRRKGALAICAGMKANITIQFLDLSWNGFTDDGAMAMGLALKTNNTLIWLDLSHNRISEKGAAMLAKGLEVNDTLKTLKIGNNPIGNAGAISLIRAIAKNYRTALEDLDVNGVQVHEDFLAAAQALKQQTLASSNSSKTEFFIHINPVDVSALNRKKFSSVIASQDPMEIIQKFLEDKRLRLVDLFRNFDKDLSWKISPYEFKKGIVDAGVPLTKEQLKKLMKNLDYDKDGQVNYKEFLTGKKKMILRRREAKRQEALDKTKMKEEGKRMWSAWENALQFTSTISNPDAKLKPSNLQSRSLLFTGKKPAGKKGAASDRRTAKTTIVPVTPRLTKSFVETGYAGKETNSKSASNSPRSGFPAATSETNLEKLNLDDDLTSSGHFDLSIRVPSPRSARSHIETASFLSASNATPRRTGGRPNSRLRPPSA